MNQREIFQAVQAENRHLRQAVAELKEQQQQGQFMEQLACAALQGLCARSDHGLNPTTVEGRTEIAEAAIGCAEAVLHVIVRNMRKADAEATLNEAAHQAAEHETEQATPLQPIP